METTKRAQLLEELLSRKLDQETRDELQFAKTVLSSSPLEHKVVYMLQDHGRFKLLGEWFDEDPLETFEPFARKGGTFEDISASAFEAGAEFLLENKCCHAVAHPMAKLLLETQQQVVVTAKGWPAAAKQFATDVFLEVAVAKLALASPRTTANDCPQLQPDMVKTLHKSWASLNKNAADTRPGALVCLQKAIDAEKEREIAERERETAERKEKKETLDVAKNSGGQHGAEELAAPNRADLTMDDLTVGAEVIVLAPGKDKHKYHEKSAVVVVLNKASCHVELKDGPAAGEQIKRTFKQIRLPAKAAGLNVR